MNYELGTKFNLVPLQRQGFSLQERVDCSVDNIKHETEKQLNLRFAGAGFSIIETIVAIAILSVAMVTPLSLAQRGLSASVYARDQITAFYLGQEAVEYVRNIRDNNNLSGNSGGPNWLSGLGACFEPGICGMDVTGTNGTVIDCSASSSRDCLLTYNSATGIYGSERDSNGTPVSGSVDSLFKRKFQIKIVPIGSDDNAEALITVTVSWVSGVLSKTVVIKERILNWYPAQVI